MISNFIPANDTNAVRLLRVANALASIDESQIASDLNFRQRMSGSIDGTDTIYYLSPSDTFPRGIVMRNDTDILLFLGGARDQPQKDFIYRVLRDGTDPILSPLPATKKYSPMVYEQVVELFGRPSAGFWYGARNIYLYGYSWGGAIATAFARLLRDLGIRSYINVISFGSPRPGEAELYPGTPSWSTWRYFTQLDPVPHIPPHYDEAPGLHIMAYPHSVFGRTLTSRFNQHVQPDYGIELGNDGTFRTKLNSNVSTFEGFTLSGYLQGNYGTSNPAHSISTYIAYLQIAAQLQTQPPLATIRSREEPYDPPARVIAAIRSQTVQRMENQIRAGTADWNSLGANVKPQDARTRFRIAQMNGVWGVVYGSDVVYVGIAKREAKRVAKAANKSKGQSLIGA